MENLNQGFKVLFVDNSRTTRATMTKIFEQKGFNVETAASGPEAIEMIKAGGFDIVVMDLYMPMMNGYEAAKIVRELEDEKVKNIPILALTASNDEKDVNVTKEAGMNEFIIKSMDHKELFEALSRWREKLVKK